MKVKILLISAFFLGFATITNAQSVHTTQQPVNVSANPHLHNNPMSTAEARANFITKKFDDRLHLSASQKADMYKVNLKLEQRIDKSGQNHDINLKRQILIDRVAAYKKILTPAQFQQSGLDQLESKLNATDKQITQ